MKEVIENIKRLKAEIEWEYSLEYQVLLDTAIEVLEKQIPKKPKNLTWELLLEAGWVYGCPSCGCAVGKNKYHSAVTQEDEYCPTCGQKLEWS